jgi:MinD superfamily P-loop ATPase
MGPGEENSGKLVAQVRKVAKEIATASKAEFIINDGPP